MRPAERASRVRVGVRVKPQTTEEGEESALTGDDRRIVVRSRPGVSYEYDRVFWPGPDGQRELFDELGLPLLKSFLAGRRVCLFAYGQTGSGKTYSMTGPDGALGPERGAVPRFCRGLFDALAADAQVAVSYFEIYNEKIRDLLSEARGDRISLRVREHPVDGPYVENLSARPARSFADIATLLDEGNGRRATAATLQNDHSSRSHCVLELTVVASSSRAKASLVDLAGSERVSRSGHTGDRYREGLSINGSLLTLGKVIKALSSRKASAFVPYRESVLTWLLKRNLGEDSRTAMLATVTPELSALEETSATLRYACRARRIVNRPSVEGELRRGEIEELKREIERLRSMKDAVSTETDESSSSKRRRRADDRRLRAELERLTESLAAAEARKGELERERSELVEGLKAADVAVYESDFFEQLEDILDDSTDEDVSEETQETRDEVCGRLRDVEVSIETLKNCCSSAIERRTFDSLVLPVLSTMKRKCEELQTILESNTIGKDSLKFHGRILSDFRS